jgi:flagellar biosynthesis component FlhA
MCERITLVPIPVHKAFDEILLPVYDNLMDENKVEREKDHFDVRKKEIHYKNEKRKELEQMYYDNVTGILGLKDDMEKMKAEIDGEAEAIHFINESLIRYKNLQSDIISDIEQSNEELKFQIHEVRQKILDEVNRIRDGETDLLNQQLTELSKARRLDDELRDSVQRQILSANLEQNQILNAKLDELNNITREGYEKMLKSSKIAKDAVKTNNVIQSARNRERGMDPYDDSFILRPARSLKHEVAEISNPA